ncbi:DUF4260 domain-containing protein [Algoriphagus sp. CAU 1675]|uniref:DUF4260 domain-containing protein n=1 Tax=Algoriphagus sp. CAU 1675 TaxID=3032597 RepID=UPI0023DA2DF4|nr:DUF4260 domain-containing protein [Algoriphagus sp. CAU 1675]MDF2158583.1 DUF4260 domain-containing protein [Algoriphagus sp. CAU 1675]
MKGLLKLEELGMLILSFWAFHLTEQSWWWFFGLFLVPDIGMTGYLLNEKTGSWTYNIFHHKGIALLVFFTGVFLSSMHLQIAGIILFAHASFDRMLGYGLKYEKGFKFTHLGEIGPSKNKQVL